MNATGFRNEFKHECELPPKEDVLSASIQEGHWVNLRRTFRRWLLLRESDNRSKMIFKSSAVMRYEKLKHVKFHYYMIHPFSSLMFFWELFMVLIFFAALVLIPVHILTQFTHLYNSTFDIICIINVIIEMNTGYLDTTTSKVIMDRKEVAKYRFKTWFFVDIIGSCNYHMLSLFFGNSIKRTFMQYTIFVKFLRVITVWKYIEDIRKRTHGTIFRYQILKLSMMVVLSIFWCTAIIHQIFKNENSHMEFYDNDVVLYHLRASLQLLFIFGFMFTDNIPLILFQAFGLHVGFVMQMLIISQIVNITFKHKHSRQKYYELTQEIYEFMRHKCLPTNVRDRISTYLNFRFQQNYYNEKRILSQFPLIMRQEIMLHTNMHLLEKVYIFSELPMPILYNLISSMTSEIFLPSDVIISAGTHGECMLLVASGSAAVYTAAGKEICHLSDGANFGELSLISDNEHRMASVVAIDVCEVLILQRKDFLKQIEKYPEIYERIRKIAQEKVKRTLFTGDENSDILSSNSNAGLQQGFVISN